MPPKKTTATSHDSATGAAPTAAIRRSSRGKSAEPQPTAKEKGKAKALETVEETGSDDTPHATPKHVEEAPTAKERKKGMTLEEYFGPGVDLNQPLYKPHGKWAYTYGNDFKEVECIKRLSHGAQAEVWYNSAIVEGGERFDYIAKRWSVWAEWRGFFSEIYLYASSKHLRTLQGDCVPFFIGIHNALGGYISFAMEPMDKTGWNEAHPRISRRLKEMVVQAFEKLHAKGVLHNDVELRHMLINDTQDKVMIIDFQESKSLNPCEDVGLRECTQADLDKEMNKVKDLIDWDGYMADDRRKLNRAKRNYRRRVQRDRKAGEYKEPDWVRWTETPPWYRGDPDHDPSEDEAATDTETAEWEKKLQVKTLLEYEELEGDGLGRRFTVPTEEDREAARHAAGETERLLLEQRRLRIEMEKAKKKAKAAEEEGKTEGEVTKTSAGGEVATVTEVTEGTPAEMDRPGVHFAEGASASQSQPNFIVDVMPFKRGDPPSKLEGATPGKATEAAIHPPGSESSKRRSTSPPPGAHEPDKKKPKKPTKTAKSKAPDPERPVTRSSAKAAGAGTSSSDATPAANAKETRSKSKKTSTSATPRTRKAAAPEPIPTSSTPGTSQAKRKRASSTKQAPSLADHEKASGSSKDNGAATIPPRQKRARKAKAT
ncbi:hypothetical protein FRC04_008893 [Tulasnella sp. 424]|nr:hypothetical protein FRC04_008893 [Tulasnella sp. 424]KAG8973793.1 hypothetical protein FRC05_008212 [Tulasnella sp. 425]